MDHQYPTVAKIPVLDTGKFEQWQFRIQQYLQHEHYALWEVIEFGDSYKVPTNTDPNDTSRRKDDEQSERTITITTEDMQRKKNDVKARTTLLLSLSDEHQLRFSKYKTAKELWAAILKTFGGNDATKKRKNNLLKQQYGNFKAEGNDLDTMSLDDLYNHLKVYEVEVQTKSNSNSQNMAFISSSKNSSGNKDDVAGFDKSKVECFNCHKMGPFVRECRASRSQERGKKESYRQGSKTKEKNPKALMAIDGVGWDWSYMANEGVYHALVADGVTPTEFALMANTESK
nr:hypothetical protein [Tanacetum cinerariifolium]